MWFSKKTNREYVIKPMFTLSSDFIIVTDETDVTRDLKITRIKTEEMPTVKRKVVKKNVYLEQICCTFIAILLCIASETYIAIGSIKIISFVLILVIWANCFSSFSRTKRSNEFIETVKTKAVQVDAMKRIKEVLKSDTTALLKAIKL